MTLSYTPRFHLAIPDFLSEPWHAEFAAAMESIDQALYTAIVAQETSLWQNSHTYLIGDIIIDPGTGTLYAAAVAHTSSDAFTAPTFAFELSLHPTFWTSFAVTAASQSEAEVGTDNSKYMTPLRTAQAITAQSPTPGIATQVQAEEGIDNSQIMTPLRVRQSTTARLASNAQAVAGTDNTVLMTPLRTTQLLDSAGISGGTQIGFSAHKNGVSQTGIVNGAPTKITYGTELYDLGSFYDTANSRWTPPPGVIHISASFYITGLSVNANQNIFIYKNGTSYKQQIRPSSASGDIVIEISIDDTANGTDYYEVFVGTTSAATSTASGLITATFFMGHFLGQVGSVTLGVGQIGFRAHKNSVDQNIPNSASTKVTFGFEDYDQGNRYDPVLSRWTPPTGLVHIDAAVYFSSGLTANNLLQCQIYKNGALLKNGLIDVSTVALGGSQISVDDIANGTDYYELFVFTVSGGVAPLSGSPINTYFSGHFLGGSQGVQGDIGPAGPAGSVTAPAINSGRLRLVSSTLLSFTPYNGDRIKINGVLYQIPVAGIVGMANTGVYVNGSAGANLAADTTYYVYAFIDGASTVTADFSVTGHATSATVGNAGTEIKIGDDTRTLIGMIRTSGVQFIDTTTQRFVLNWFNRRSRPMRGTATPSVFIYYAVWQEISAASRLNFLTWAEEPVSCTEYGAAYPYDTAITLYAAIALDVVTGSGNLNFTYSTQQPGWWSNLSNSAMFDTTEGFHFLTPVTYGSNLYSVHSVALNAIISG